MFFWRRELSRGDVILVNNKLDLIVWWDGIYGFISCIGVYVYFIVEFCNKGV